MKVIHIISQFPQTPGSHDDVILPMAKALQKAGIESEIFTSENKTKQPLPKKDDRDESLDDIYLKLFPAKEGRNGITITGIIDAVERSGAEVAHVHGFETPEMIMPFLKSHIAKVKIVFSPRLHPSWDADKSRQGTEMKKRHSRTAVKFAKNAHALTAECAIDRDFLSSEFGIEPDKIRIVPLGIDISRFDPPTSGDSFRKKYGIDGRFVLFAGRLLPNRGLDVLLDSVPLVTKEFIDVNFVIAGEDGGILESLKKKAGWLGVSDRVSFTGRLPDEMLAGAYGASDLLVMPSEFEVFGRPVLEAMACGKAVIGTKTGGMPDAIIHGKTGILIEYGNKDQLADRICDLLLDEHRRKSMGDAGRERVREHFTWNSIAAQLKDVYDTVTM